MSVKFFLVPHARVAAALCPICAILLAFVALFTVVDPGDVQAQATAEVSRPNLKAPVSTAPAASTSPSATSDIPASSIQTFGSDEYVINPEDVLDVYVYDVPELSREYTVNSAGNVTVPLLPKQVPAAGMSPDQFARSLEQSFRQAGSLSRPQITVSIKQSRRSVVTVEGAVKTPQVVPVIGRTRLTSVLAQCGGLADDAGSTATITRGPMAPRDSASGGGPMAGVVSVELKKLMDGNDPTSQSDVWPGDRVSVEHAGVFYVLGEVNHPGGFNLKSADEQLTVLQALAIAGDVTSVAKKNKAVIIRKDAKASGGRQEVALDVPSILAGKTPDHVLQANDILYVPASGGKKAMHAITSGATTIATGAGTAVVYRR
jgi:polysaccharide biosynthesis/export protein